jgi:glycosyltransferase involved in cell wall biosynthesis
MKIAFINIYQGKVERGLETFISEVFTRLKTNNQVDVFFAKSALIKRWPILWRLYLDPHGIKIALFTLSILPKIIKEKYDIVVAQNGGWQPAILRIVTWLYGGKLVITGQSGKGWDDRNNLWTFPDYFVAISKSNLKWSKKVNPFIKTAYIPNGVDLDKFKPTGKIYKTGLKKPIIICQGAAEPEKRLHLVIDAVSRMGQASLLIVGDGSIKESIQELGSELLGERFKMIQVPHNKMPSVYRSANVFTLPSVDTEAFGIAIVEAMATNLPVVVTDNSTRRKIVGKAGYLVDPTNIEEYSEKLNNALKTSFGNKPRKKAEDYSWDKIAVQYENLFQKIG